MGYNTSSGGIAKKRPREGAFRISPRAVFSCDTPERCWTVVVPYKYQSSFPDRTVVVVPSPLVKFR